MKSLRTFALLTLAAAGSLTAGNAFAGRPIKLATIMKQKTMSSLQPGTPLMLSVPRGTRLAKDLGGAPRNVLQPVIGGKLNKAGNAVNYRLGVGSYRVNNATATSFKVAAAWRSWDY